MAKRIRIIPWLDESQLDKQLNNIGKKQQKVKVNINSENINDANNQMKKLNNTTDSTSTAFGKLKNTIGNTFSTGKLAMTGYLAVLNEIIKAGKNAKQTINELDKAVTDLSVATNMSRESVSELVKDYNNYAKELKSTTTQITSAADDYLRAGKSMSEAQTLIKDSIMLSKLGQLESGTATEDLLAVMNGFNMSVEDVGKSLDAMVALDMAAATSSGDIATALKYCASSADVAGLSFNKLAAMITTVQDKTQQSAETIGTFMNTLLSRYRNVKIGQFVDDDGEDLSEVETILSSLDIKLRDSSQEFRNFEEVIEEVALSWNDYSSVQQAAIAKAFSGTRQQNRFLALMEGYNKTLELTEVAANSAGTAIDKFNNSYMNSLEAKQNALQASFESMVINSDFDEVYAGIIDATTALVDFVNETNALKGVMAGLAVSGGIKFFLAARTGINEAYISLNKFSNALSIVKKTQISTSDFDRLLLLSNGLSDSQMKLLLSSKNLTITQKELVLTNSGLSSEEAKLQLETWGMTTAQNGLTAATTTLGNAFKGLVASMAANPFMIVTMAVSSAVMAYQAYNQKLEETRQKNIEASETAIEHADSLRKLYTEYKRLSSIQDKTSSEEEEFKSVVENVTKALGDKAQILEGLTVGTNEYADALARVTKEELQSQAVTATIGRKSAEEELQSKTWSSVKGSKVSIDSNSKGKALSDETQKAVDIVSDSLKEYETVNRTWKNISWDISSDDPIEALEFYNSLVEAREKLVLASEDDETLLDTEIYKDLNTAINTMSESLDTYVEKLYEEEKLNYMAQNNIPSVTEEYKAMESALVSAAGSSVDLQDKFKELLMSDFSDLATNIEEIGNELNDVKNQADLDIPSTISSSISQLAIQLEPQFAELGEAYQDIFTTDGFTLENVDNSMLEGLRSTFAEIEEEVGVAFDSSVLEPFFATLTNGNSTAEQVQQAFNDLATAYFYSTDTLEQLNSETADAIEKQLEEMGVVNAQTVVADALAAKTEELIAQKEYLAQTGKLLSDASDEEATAFILEQIEAGNCGEALALLQLKKLLVNSTQINTAADIQQIMNLASAAGMGAEVLTQLANAKSILSTVENGGTVSMSSYDKALSDVEAAKQTMLDWKPVEIDFSSIGGGTSGASSAGSDAGDAYVEAFEDELSELENLRDSGVISEKEYLDRLRELYTRYFKDRKEYLDEYMQYERQYLEGMKSLYESALSGISKLMDSKIDGYTESKEVAVSSLKAEQEAAEDAYQAQIDLIQEQIDAIDGLIDEKQKQIDALNDEIDKIREASEARKRDIELRKAQYELERMQNQRTQFIYDGEQMVYRPDESGIRDARENITEIQEEMQIAELEKQISLIEKEIDLLEDQKDALEKQQDAIQKMIDESNKYYESLISQTETYYDSLIKNMEKQKSKWEELAEIEEIAEAYSAIEQVFGDLGYTVEDVLNGSEGAFEDFKDKYISLINDMNNNSSFAEGLSYATGVAKENLGSFLDKTQETANGLDELGEKSSALDSIAKGMNNASASATALNTSTEGLKENISGISDSLNNIPTDENLTNLTTAFTNLGDAITGVANALGIDEEGTVGGLISALQSISEFSLGEDGEGIVSQFQNLKTAIDDVTSAIGGSGGSAGSTGGDASTSSSPSMSAGANGTGGLTGAINDLKSATDEALDSGGEESSEGEGTGAIGQFEQLKEAVDNVTTSIGGGEDSEGSGGEEDVSSLIGAITNLGDKTEEILVGGEDGGESGGVIGRFEEFKDVIGEANEHVTGISEGLDAIDGQEVECTIKVNIETTGGLPAGLAHSTGTALDSMKLESDTYTAKYLGNAHVEGTALVSGNWAVQSDEKQALVGEEGFEIIVIFCDFTQ